MPALAGLSQPQFAQAFALLVESAQVHPDARLRRRRRATASLALNEVLLDEAHATTTSVRFLAAPALGSGVFVSHPEQLVAARHCASSTAPTSMRFATSSGRQFKAQDKRLAKDGQAIQGEAENLAELERRIRGFIAERLPLLRSLGVVEGPLDAA